MDDGYLTLLLQRIHEGDEKAAAEFFSLVYDTLRGNAHLQMLGERRDHTLQTTALVHECYASLMSAAKRAPNRRYFFAAAAKAMRRLLVDHARARNAEKRGGGRQRESLEVASRIDSTLQYIERATKLDYLMLEEALAKLEEKHPSQANALQLRFFVGLTIAEIAECMNVTEDSVFKYLRFAKAWLKNYLTEDG